MADAKYRVKGKHIFRTIPGESRLEVIETGDVFVPTATEIRVLGDRLERVEDTKPAPKSSKSDKAPESSAAPSKESDAQDAEPAPKKSGEGGLTFKALVKKLTVNEILDRVSRGEMDAQRVLDAERTGKKRKTLISELDEILNQ